MKFLTSSGVTNGSALQCVQIVSCNKHNVAQLLRFRPAISRSLCDQGDKTKVNFLGAEATIKYPPKKKKRIEFKTQTLFVTESTTYHNAKKEQHDL